MTAAAAHSEAGLRLIQEVFEAGGFGRGIGRTLGIRGETAGPGTAVLAGHPTEDHQNPLGTVHGGYLATLLDGAMALALQTCLDPGTGYATTDLNISYLKAVRKDAGLVRAEARIMDLGRTRALAEARLVDASGQLCAFATAGFAVKR